MTRLTLVMVAVAAVGTAVAQVPTRMNHQGRLFTTSGQPVSGNHNLNFKLYTGSSGGVAAWSEDHFYVFANGYYAVTLGSTVPLPADLFDGKVLFLGVGIDNGAELSPRQALDTVPYAFATPASGVRLLDGGTLFSAAGAWQGPPAPGPIFAFASNSAGGAIGGNGTLASVSVTPPTATGAFLVTASACCLISPTNATANFSVSNSTSMGSVQTGNLSQAAMVQQCFSLQNSFPNASSTRQFFYLNFAIANSNSGPCTAATISVLWAPATLPP